MATTSVPATPSQKISLFHKISKKTLDKKADGNWNLARALENDLPVKDVCNYIFFAKLKDHDHEAALSPVLLCKWLKGGSVVRTVKIGNANPFREIPEAVGEQYTFFLKTTDRRRKEAILAVYEGNDLCVVAFNRETLEEALCEDKRLTNVERFQLYRVRDIDRQSLVYLDEKACDYSNVFNVCVEKKRKVSTSSESSPLTIKESTEEDPEEHVTHPEEHVTLQDYFFDEIAKHMIKQDDARSTLISQTEQRKLFRKFAKTTPTARPARTLKPLASYIKSVGYLVCGNVQGTCFLVQENLVMTSRHIVNMIMEARRNATDQNNKDAHAAIYIYFDFLYAGQILRELLPRVEVDETIEYGNPHLDYSLLKLKENDVLGDRTLLGPMVRNTIPESGIVTIIGHPDGGEMLEDACSICRQSNIASELYSRAEKKAKHCVDNPMSCSNNNVFAKCVHMYIGRSLQRHSNQLAYDTTLFYGTSGSPVFNMDGHVVAIHTQGYPTDDNKGGNTSIMEFGVTFAAIFEDVKSKFGEKLANYLFPNIGV